MSSPKKLSSPPPFKRLLAQLRLAILLDFDGTLVPIAPEPDAIRVASGLSEGLEALSARLSGRLALVSGRSLEDLSRHVGSPKIFRAGSHGAACCAPDGTRMGPEPRAIPAAVSVELASFADREGLHFEPKTHGAALHYRARPDLGSRAVEYAESIAAKHGLETKAGKSVVELVSPGGGKDGAVNMLMTQAQFVSCVPVFIGDDVTDEDGFVAAASFGGFGIAVGERPSINAKYHLETVQDVHEWLKL